MLAKIMAQSRIVNNFINQIYYQIASPICVLCGSYALPHNICQACQQDLPILPQCCLCCAQFLQTNSKNLLCGKCLTIKPPYEQTFALLPYLPPIIYLITTLKFKGELCFAKLFSNLLIQKINEWYQKTSLPDFLIPIPLHTKRLAERGFNQSLEIGKPIARHFKINLITKGVLRVKETRAQSNLSAKDRRLNVKDAFHISQDFTGAHLAVLDDVITTGHTIREFCEALKQKGARIIDVWCCARKG